MVGRAKLRDNRDILNRLRIATKNKINDGTIEVVVIRVGEVTRWCRPKPLIRDRSSVAVEESGGVRSMLKSPAIMILLYLAREKEPMEDSRGERSQTDPGGR